MSEAERVAQGARGLVAELISEISDEQASYSCDERLWRLYEGWYIRLRPIQAALAAEPTPPELGKCGCCGGPIIWQNEERRVLMCPNCVMERCLRAELKLGWHPHPPQAEPTREQELVGADKLVDGIFKDDLSRKVSYLLPGETMMTGNVGAWYHDAVYWKYRALAKEGK